MSISTRKVPGVYIKELTATPPKKAITKKKKTAQLRKLIPVNLKPEIQEEREVKAFSVKLYASSVIAEKCGQLSRAER